MSVSNESADPSREVPVAAFATSLGRVADYLALTKPRVMSLVLFTAVVGLFAAPVHVDPLVGFGVILCIALGAGAAGALNMWYDADVDRLMSRTAARPIPRGRVRPGEALAFAGIAASRHSSNVKPISAAWAACAREIPNRSENCRRRAGRVAPAK